MLNSFSAVTWLWWQWSPGCVTASVPTPVDGGAIDAFARAYPIGQFGFSSGGWGIRVTEFNPRETILILEMTSESKCCLALCAGRSAAGPADVQWQVMSCSVSPVLRHGLPAHTPAGSSTLSVSRVQSSQKEFLMHCTRIWVLKG